MKQLQHTIRNNTFSNHNYSFHTISIFQKYIVLLLPAHKVSCVVGVT